MKYSWVYYFSQVIHIVWVKKSYHLKGEFQNFNNFYAWILWYFEFLFFEKGSSNEVLSQTMKSFLLENISYSSIECYDNNKTDKQILMRVLYKWQLQILRKSDSTKGTDSLVIAQNTISTQWAFCQFFIFIIRNIFRFRKFHGMKRNSYIIWWICSKFNFVIIKFIRISNSILFS